LLVEEEERPIFQTALMDGTLFSPRPVAMEFLAPRGALNALHKVGQMGKVAKECQKT
jgi:hypothetical protein